MVRTQSMGFAPAVEAANTSAPPSGERANCGTGTVAITEPEKTDFSGGYTAKRTGDPASGPRPDRAANHRAIIRSAPANAIQPVRSRHGLFFWVSTVPS